ncbi:unnamed protein product [Bathycoccus prasinos]
MFIKKRISKVFLVSAIFFFFIARAKAADFDVDDDEDIDTISQMRQAYLEEQIKESKVTLFDIKTGEKLESAAAWASYDPRNASRMHVGYFIPDAEEETGAAEMENLQLCGFTKPENCKNEQPYPRATKQTRNRSRTRFVCEKVSFKVEEDGDLAYEGDISVPKEKEGEGDAAASTNNRKLLQLRRRSVGLRSRSLRSNGARGRIG